MSVSTYPKYSINPQPTEAELVKAREIIAEAKKKAKLNRPQNSQQAWENLESAIKEIREDFVNNNG